MNELTELERALVTLNCVRAAREYKWIAKSGDAPEWVTENLAHWANRVAELEAAEKDAESEPTPELVPKLDEVLERLVVVEGRGKAMYDRHATLRQEFAEHSHRHLVTGRKDGGGFNVTLTGPKQKETPDDRDE